MVVKVLWTLCYASPEKIPECSVHVAPLETARIFNVEMIP